MFSAEYPRLHVTCQNCAARLLGCCCPACAANTTQHFVRRTDAHWPRSVQKGKVVGRGAGFRAWLREMSHPVAGDQCS